MTADSFSSSLGIMHSHGTSSLYQNMYSTASTAIVYSVSVSDFTHFISISQISCATITWWTCHLSVLVFVTRVHFTRTGIPPPKLKVSKLEFTKCISQANCTAIKWQTSQLSNCVRYFVHTMKLARITICYVMGKVSPSLNLRGCNHLNITGTISGSKQVFVAT